MGGGAYQACKALNLRTTTSQKCVVATEEGSYLRLIDSCITQLKAQGPSRTCNESKEDEEEVVGSGFRCEDRVQDDPASGHDLDCIRGNGYQGRTLRTLCPREVQSTDASEVALQGYHAYTKPPPRRTLQ